MAQRVKKGRANKGAGEGRRRRKRATALVRAEHGEPAVKLSAAQKGTLDQALRQGQDLAEEMEAKMMAYGRWLLEAVFANDTTTALNQGNKNPVWLELIRRAGGPTLALNRHAVYAVVRLAAYDRRLNDEAWRNLGRGRKELLMPLDDDDRIREAAQHVSAFKLSETKTHAYVTSLLAEQGSARIVRLTPAGLVGRARTLRESLAAPGVLASVRRMHESLDRSESAAVAAELDALAGVIANLSRALRGRPVKTP